jgi:hypothetical protein
VVYGAACADRRPSDAALRQQHGVRHRHPLELSLPAGYSLLSASLAEADGSQLLAHAAVWVPTQREHDVTEQVHAQLLATAHAVVRKDEAEDRAERRHIIAMNAALYESSKPRRHPRLTLREPAADIRDLLDPALVAALAARTPWDVIRGADHRTRCRGKAAVDETGAPLPDRNVYCSTGVYTIPVFRSDVNAELVEEILHAKSSALGPALSLPVS